MIQVDGRITAAGSGIDIHNFQVFADRTGLHIFPDNVQSRLIDLQRVRIVPNKRIECKNSKTALLRRRDGRIHREFESCGV